MKIQSDTPNYLKLKIKSNQENQIQDQDLVQGKSRKLEVKIKKREKKKEEKDQVNSIKRRKRLVINNKDHYLREEILLIKDYKLKFFKCVFYLNFFRMDIN